MENDKEDKIFSVSEYIDILNFRLKQIRVKIIGEVGKVDIWQSGHAYFTLRDEKDKSVINCVMWRTRYALFGIKLKEGDKVIAEGYSDIYKPTGKLSFIAETIELAGEGRLKKEYEELKRKLAGEGIFEESRKRAIPMYVQKIGIVTSKQGAVLGDFLSNIGSHGFKIKMIDSRVEGQSAITDLLSAVRTFREKDIEVLIIMRGGGSFESLQSFNNELLVREIANFPVPVISAIGHDKDIPLVSLAADFQVSTPSIAAISLSKSWKEARFEVDKYERSIVSLFNKQLSESNSFLNGLVYELKEKFGAILNRYKELESRFKIFLVKIKHGLISREEKITDCSKLILRVIISALRDIGRRINEADKLIASYNPERQIRLGYSITRHKGRLVKSIENVKTGEDIDIQIFDGSIQSKIKNIIKK